jgi:hypothetical protein
LNDTADPAANRIALPRYTRCLAPQAGAPRLGPLPLVASAILLGGVGEGAVASKTSARGVMA